MENKVMDALLSRRSCRSYTGEMPTSEELKAILNAGLYAPSGKNNQTSVTVCVTDKAVRDKLSCLNAEVLGRDDDPFYGAPAVIAVLGDSTCPLYVQDGSLVMQNLMLASYSLGLATCWINRAYEVFRSLEGKKIKQGWKIPEQYEGIAFCIVGHASGAMDEAKPRRSGRIIFV